MICVMRPSAREVQNTAQEGMSRSNVPEDPGIPPDKSVSQPKLRATSIRGHALPGPKTDPNRRRDVPFRGEFTMFRYLMFKQIAAGMFIGLLATWANAEQSDSGDLEVIVRVGDRLQFFWCDSSPEHRWNGPSPWSRTVSKLRVSLVTLY